MFTERTSVGLDVHARSVVALAIDTTTGELFKQKLVPANESSSTGSEALPGPVAVTYEAGPTGFGLARAMGRGRTAVRGRGALEDSPVPPGTG